MSFRAYTALRLCSVQAVLKSGLVRNPESIDWIPPQGVPNGTAGVYPLGAGMT